MSRISITGLFIYLCAVPVLAALPSGTGASRTIQGANSTQFIFHSTTLLLAEASPDEAPEPGSLVIPGESGDKSEDKKQCLTVCKQWGENCIINPRTGARNCRRICKEFGEECF